MTGYFFQYRIFLQPYIVKITEGLDDTRFPEVWFRCRHRGGVGDNGDHCPSAQCPDAYAMTQIYRMQACTDWRPRF
jgi:hypothetical protein